MPVNYGSCLLLLTPDIGANTRSGRTLHRPFNPFQMTHLIKGLGVKRTEMLPIFQDKFLAFQS
jgi:hypothetical protein